MRAKTRELLGVLADDLNDRVLDALRHEHTEADLIETLNVSRATVRDRLARLRDWGLVTDHRPARGRGQPAFKWKARSPERLAELAESADALAGDLRPASPAPRTSGTSRR